MAFLVRDCIRCGVTHVQLNLVGSSLIAGNAWEISVACQACSRISIYDCLIGGGNGPQSYDNLDSHPRNVAVAREAVKIVAIEPILSEYVPPRINALFVEAAVCKALGRFEAAGAIFRKTIDVASKHLYANDARLTGRSPADALRSRLKALGDMKILEEDIIELADVAALDGNDAAHDVDPYTSAEAEALEELTADLLDRLFVRPAKLAAVKAKQIAAGQRKPS